MFYQSSKYSAAINIYNLSDTENSQPQNKVKQLTDKTEQTGLQKTGKLMQKRWVKHVSY